MTEGTMTVLDELLSDPMVQMVMARDSVRPEDLRRMLERHRVPSQKAAGAARACDRFLSGAQPVLLTAFPAI